jgi:hypothetical protein
MEGSRSCERFLAIGHIHGRFFSLPFEGLAMKKSRRDLEIFSLSFLDCICCGFGALILLFVLSKFGAPVIMEEIREDLQGSILRLEETFHELRGETEVLNRQLKSKEEQLSRKNPSPDCKGISHGCGRVRRLQAEQRVQNIIEETRQGTPGTH